MVTLVTSYNDNISVFKYYWGPLMLKYAKFEFILINTYGGVIETGSYYDVQKVVSNLKRMDIKNKTESQCLIDAVKKAKNSNVFYTPMNLLPTYEMMVLLENYDDNVILRPTPFKSDGYMCPAWAFKRDKFNDLNFKEHRYHSLPDAYIAKYEPKQLYKGTVYNV